MTTRKNRAPIKDKTLSSKNWKMFYSQIENRVSEVEGNTEDFPEDPTPLLIEIEKRIKDIEVMLESFSSRSAPDKRIEEIEAYLMYAAPLTANLDADTLDGLHASSFASSGSLEINPTFADVTASRALDVVYQNTTSTMKVCIISVRLED